MGAIGAVCAALAFFRFEDFGQRCFNRVTFRD